MNQGNDFIYGQVGKPVNIQELLTEVCVIQRQTDHWGVPFITVNDEAAPVDYQ